jgi:hypothetical protein
MFQLMSKTNIPILTKEIENLLDKPYFKDLLEVGTRKALGYLPLNTINEYGGCMATIDLIEWAFDNEFEAKVYMTGNVFSGALYVWNVEMLEKLLLKYKDILVNANVPVDPDQYVYYIQHNTIDFNLYPEAFMVVGLTFNDRRFKGKSIKYAKKLVQ